MGINNPSPVVTGSYASAYFSQASTWSTTSATFADPTNSGGNTLTIRQSSGITLTAAGSSICGVTFTPPNNTCVYLVSINAFISGIVNSSIGGMQLTDGTTTIATASLQGNSINGVYVCLQGIYAPASASAVTVKVQGAVQTGSTFTINGNGQSGAVTMEWVVLRIF